MSFPADSRRQTRRGLSLLELVVVLAILLALAAIAVPMVSDSARQGRETATRESLRRLQDVIMNRYWPDMNLVMPGRDGLPQPSPGDLNLADARVDHPQLHFLFVKPASAPVYDPIARRGWNGPYLQSGGVFPNLQNFSDSFGEQGDLTVLDAWNHPIVLVRVQNAADPYLFARLISAGDDGLLNTADDLSLDLRKAP